jgi:hypothetical protein
VTGNVVAVSVDMGRLLKCVGGYAPDHPYLGLEPGSGKMPPRYASVRESDDAEIGSQHKTPVGTE